MKLKEFLLSHVFVKYLGWLKFVLSILITIGLIVVNVFYTSVSDTVKKSSKSDSTSGFSFASFFDGLKKSSTSSSPDLSKSDSSSNSTIILILCILFLIAYSGSSFVFIIGTINRDCLKVLYFLIVEIIFSLLMIYTFIDLYPSTIILIIALPIQIFSIFIVFNFWNELRQDFNRRRENQELRERQKKAEQSFQQEVEKYHARIKIEEEEEPTN